MKNLFILLVVAILLAGCVPSSTQSSDVQDSEPEIVFDVTQFYESSTSTVSEEKLIEMLGEPASIEDWKHDTGARAYPIHTLYYYPNDNEEEYAYHFNNGMLQRISIENAEIPYTDKSEILSMFGLKKYSNTVVEADTGVAYRVTNCGVRQLWIAIMDEKTLQSIRIDFSTLFPG